MVHALIAIRAAFHQIGLYLGLMLVTNVAGTVLTLPILVVGVAIGGAFHAVGPFAGALVVAIGVLPAPSGAGVQFVAHEAATRNPVLWRDQLDGLRRYAWPAFRVWVVSVLVSLLLAGNAVYYSRSGVPLARSIEIGWLLALLFWLVMHFYVYPLIIEQEQKRTLLIYRNAALIALARPLFTMVVALVWLVILFSMSLTGLIGIIGLSLCAAIQQNATAKILQTFDQE